MTRRLAMSASTSTPWGASVSAGAEPNRALSTDNRRSSMDPLAAEDVGNGQLDIGDRRALLAATLAPALPRDQAADARDVTDAGQGTDHSWRIVGRAARDVERRRGERPARRRDDVGCRGILGD